MVWTTRVVTRFHRRRISLTEKGISTWSARVVEPFF